MKVHKGKAGLDKTWQGPFKETEKCIKCGSESRIAFVAMEEPSTVEDDGLICEAYPNVEGSMWVHDACAIAVYLCKKCLKPTAIMNQA